MKQRSIWYTIFSISSMVCRYFVIFTYQYLFQSGTDSSVNKLTVISQRENVLNAIGALSRSPSTSISQEEILKLFEKYFYPMIQQEVHEGLICHMLQQMTQWCSRLTTVNQILTDFFKVMSFIIEKVLLMLTCLFCRKDSNKKRAQRLHEPHIFNVC